MRRSWRFAALFLSVLGHVGATFLAGPLPASVRVSEKRDERLRVREGQLPPGRDMRSDPTQPVRIRFGADQNSYDEGVHGENPARISYDGLKEPGTGHTLDERVRLPNVSIEDGLWEVVGVMANREVDRRPQ